MELTYEIKKYKTSEYKHNYELYINDRYVNTFTLLRHAKNEIENYKNGKEISYPFQNDPIIEVGE